MSVGGIFKADNIPVEEGLILEILLIVMYLVTSGIQQKSCPQ